jgi:hypothetical protein
MNEPSSPQSPTQSTTSLRSLQEILHNRIIQKKGEIHESHNRVYNDNLWREIETLQWVLGQILTLRRTRIQFQQQQQNYLSNNK